MREAALGFVAVLLGISSANAATLAAKATRAIEGTWCTDSHSGDTESESYEFEFEFERSRGSVFFSDGTDLQERGPITSAREHGRDIYISVRFGGARESVMHLRRQSMSKLILVDAETTNGGSVNAVLSKCGRADPRTVENLSWQSARRLSVADNGVSITFAAPRSEGVDPCTPNGEYLKFDLIGPVDYFVWHWGPSKDTFWPVRVASDKNGFVEILGHADSGDVKLAVRWRDENHIVVEPWGQTFVRCQY